MLTSRGNSFRSPYDHLRRGMDRMHQSSILIHQELRFDQHELELRYVIYQDCVERRRQLETALSVAASTEKKGLKVISGSISLWKLAEDFHQRTKQLYGATWVNSNAARLDRDQSPSRAKDTQTICRAVYEEYIEHEERFMAWAKKKTRARKMYEDSEISTLTMDKNPDERNGGFSPEYPNPPPRLHTNANGERADATYNVAPHVPRVAGYVAPETSTEYFQIPGNVPPPKRQDNIRQATYSQYGPYMMGNASCDSMDYPLTITSHGSHSDEDYDPSSYQPPSGPGPSHWQGATRNPNTNQGYRHSSLHVPSGGGPSQWPFASSQTYNEPRGRAPTSSSHQDHRSKRY